MKKTKLKQIVKNACRLTAFRFLKSDIEEKNMTKLKNLKYKKLEMQGYLKSQKISLKKKKILFKARTRMLNVKSNFGDKSQCPLCNMKEDNQSHLLDCTIIKLECPDLFENKENCLYEDIFGTNIDKMNNVANLLIQAMRTREKFLKR